MTGFKVPKETWLRADLIDAGPPGVPSVILRTLGGNPASIWEIKPVSSLVTGVWQETLYRVSFNVIRRVMLATAGIGQTPGGPFVGERFLKSGGFWVLRYKPKIHGEDGYQVLLHDNIHVTSEGGEPAVAVPFQVGALPGLVGYYVLRGPNVPKLQRVIETVLLPSLLAALKKMMDEIKDTIGKGWGEAVAWAKRTYEELEPVLEAVGKALLALLMVVAIFVAAFAIGLLLLEAAAALAAALAVALATGVIVFVVVGLSGDGPKKGSGDQSARAGELTDLKIGPVLIRGMPQAKVPQFLAEVQRQMHNIAGAAADELQKRPPAVA
jgi:hypothetical protein